MVHLAQLPLRAPFVPDRRVQLAGDFCVLAESKDPNATGRIDLIGVPLGTASVAMIMFAIVQSEAWGSAMPG